MASAPFAGFYLNSDVMNRRADGSPADDASCPGVACDEFPWAHRDICSALGKAYVMRMTPKLDDASAMAATVVGLATCTRAGGGMMSAQQGP
jgi:hypothetical protein